MKAFFIIFLLTTAAVFATVASFAQQPRQNGSPMQPDAFRSGPDTPSDQGISNAPRKLSDPADRMAIRERLRERVREMEEILDRKVEAMNAAQGEQKMGAMADVINELVVQRKAMTDMLRSFSAHNAQKRTDSDMEAGAMSRRVEIWEFHENTGGARQPDTTSGPSCYADGMAMPPGPPE